jgi:poly [ADP-ribose] polymerase
MAIKSYSEGSEPFFPAKYEVVKRTTLNFTDIINNNNKFYNLEIQVAPTTEARIYTNYGRVGGTIAKEYRMFSNQSEAEKEAEKIIKSKVKKGYTEIKLLKADVGSETGKAKIETSQVSAEDLKKLGMDVKIEEEKTKLHPEVSSLIRAWFGITNEFVELNLDTKKCPLGQLSAEQIIKGKDILEEARKIVLSKPITDELNRLTNLYYSNIPHNFGYARINADLLRFDSNDKIEKAFDILDVFSDAKSVESVISKRSSVDSQYDTLKADIEYLDSEDPTYKWIDTMVHETRARNHSGLGRIKVHKIFKISRSKEQDTFLKNAEKIAKECGKFQPSDTYAKLVKKRPDFPKEKDLQKLYEQANVCPGWHGTRRANLIGITTKGLLIRPSGVVHAGSCYGDGIYWATNSTKSINYCDVKGSYWAGGGGKTAYLLMGDVTFGNYEFATGSHFYSAKNIHPKHSVFAQAGKGGVYNDEIITYHPTGLNQQHALRYVIEFETQA